LVFIVSGLGLGLGPIISGLGLGLGLELCGLVNITGKRVERKEWRRNREGCSLKPMFVVELTGELGVLTQACGGSRCKELAWKSEKKVANVIRTRFCRKHVITSSSARA